MLDEIANSSSATEDASDVFDSSIEYGIHTFVHKVGNFLKFGFF